MKKRIIIIISSIYLLLLPSTAFANGITEADTLLCTRDSSCRESLLLYFRFNQLVIDNDYMENYKTLGAFHALLSNGIAVSLIDTIFITAYASPEGDKTYNIRLAERRAEVVKNYLSEKYPILERPRICTDPRGENWTGLRRMIEDDNSVPDREEVLMILDHVKDLNRCKDLLKRLNCGYAYKYIQEHILPGLRNATVCTVQMKTLHASTLNLQISDKQKPVIEEESGTFGNPGRIDVYKPEMTKYSVFHSFRRPILALKTNLLFDLAISPNIELELPLGRRERWSLNVEWIFPWWLIDHDKYCLQLLSGGLEARYWLGKRMNRRVLTGHFFGFYAGGGKYDLQWEEKGYQGEFYIASGISYGYALPIARNLNLEFCIGIGLLQTNYKHYRTINDYRTLLWQNNGNYTWFGPTKAKISFVWVLGRKVKGGER